MARNSVDRLYEAHMVTASPFVSVYSFEVDHETPRVFYLKPGFRYEDGVQLEHPENMYWVCRGKRVSKMDIGRYVGTDIRMAVLLLLDSRLGDAEAFRRMMDHSSELVAQIRAYYDTLPIFKSDRCH